MKKEYVLELPKEGNETMNNEYSEEVINDKDIHIEITSVEDMGENFLLNGDTYVPKDENNKEYLAIQTWLSNGNTLTQKYTEEELAKKKEIERINILIEKNKEAQRSAFFINNTQTLEKLKSQYMELYIELLKAKRS